MMALPHRRHKTSTPAIFVVGGLLLLLLSWHTSTDGQTRTRRRQRNAKATATASSSPQPIAVPQLTPTPANRTETSDPGVMLKMTPAAPSATPQPAPSPAAVGETIEDDEDVVRVTSNLVVVPTSVTDAQGEPVLGLKVADFRLEEENRAQEIAQIGDAEQVPLDIAILFDVSSSVTKNFEFQKQAAAGFLKQVMKPVDRAAVFTIAEQARMTQPFDTAERAAAKLVAIPAATTPVGTAFYDTVKSAAKYLAQNAPGRHRRVILVISDGDDNFSDQIREMTIAEARAEGQGRIVPAEARRRLQERHHRAVLDVLREVQGADTVFYSINPSGPSIRLNDMSSRAQAGMQQLADATGGSAFVPEKLENLDLVFRRIAAELRAQYLLQYYSNNNAAPGKYLDIKVRAPARPELRVRARQGYYVPKPK